MRHAGYDAGCIIDEMLQIPLLCNRDRSLTEGLTEEIGMMPIALPTK